MASFLQRSEYFTAPKAGSTNWFPTANLNGAIIKDKVWFSGSYTPQIYENNVTTDFYTNAPATQLGTQAARTFVQRQTYNNKVTYEYAFGRIDAAPINSLR